MQTLFAEISWSHNVAILSKCRHSLERKFCENSRKKFLELLNSLNQIDNRIYEKMMISHMNFDKVLRKVRPKAKLIVKGKYAFLKLGEE